MEKVFWLIAALLAGLAAGIAFSHVLEIPGKRDVDDATAATIQQHLYRGYRAPSAVIESGAFVAAVAAAIFAAGVATPFWLTVAAAVALAGTFVVFVAATEVQNRRISRWRIDALTEDWHETRRRWELSHGIRAVLFLFALGLLSGAMMSS